MRMKLGEVVVQLLLEADHEAGWQAAFAWSEAALRVNSWSQMRHLRTSRPTTRKTFPIRSLRGEPVSSRVCSLAFMSIRNESRTYKFVTNPLRLNSIAQDQQIQQPGRVAAWSLCHQPSPG